MLNAWLVYLSEDIAYNEGSIDIYRSSFRDRALLNVLPAESIDVSRAGEGRLFLDGAQIDKPDIIINRSRNFRLTEAFGLITPHVYNSLTVAKFGNDKLKCYDFVRGLGVPSLPVYRTAEDVRSWPAVAKTPSGHGGSEVFLVQNMDEAYRIASEYEDIFFQEYSREGNRDIRVYIVGDRIVCGMMRTSVKGFKSNYTLGGRAEEIELPMRIAEYSNKIIEALGGIGYCGIDFIGYGDEWVFNEIEDVVGARMVYAYTKHDPIRCFTEEILADFI